MWFNLRLISTSVLEFWRSGPDKTLQPKGQSVSLSGELCNRCVLFVERRETCLVFFFSSQHKAGDESPRGKHRALLKQALSVKSCRALTDLKLQPNQARRETREKHHGRNVLLHLGKDRATWRGKGQQLGSKTSNHTQEIR